MKKKLVTILCVTTITASMLAGCGSKTAETTAPTETTAATETAADTDAAAATWPEQAGCWVRSHTLRLP